MGYVEFFEDSGRFVPHPVLGNWGLTERQEAFSYGLKDNEVIMTYDQESFAFSLELRGNELLLRDGSGASAYFRAYPGYSAFTIENEHIHQARFWEMPGIEREAVTYDEQKSLPFVEMSRDKNAFVARMLYRRQPGWDAYDFGYRFKSEEGDLWYGLLVCTGMGQWDLSRRILSVQVSGGGSPGAVAGFSSWSEPLITVYGEIAATPGSAEQRVLITPFPSLESGYGSRLLEAKTLGATPRVVCERKGVGLR